MKKIFSILLVASIFLISCDDPGISKQRLTGSESNLPLELKGLKVYKVSIGSGEYVKVAILNDKVNSTTYVKDKSTESVILIDKNTDKVYKVSSIIVENDSIIVAKK